MTERVTQVPAEVASTPDTAALRVTQLPAEVASTPDTAALRVTQVPVEAASTPDNSEVRISALMVEVMYFLLFEGSLTQTLDDVQVSSSATFVNLITATLSQTLQDVQVAARGRIPSSGLAFCKCRDITANGIGRRKT